jgi:hypothetical protein
MIAGAQFGDNQGTMTQQYALYVTQNTTNVVFEKSNTVGTHLLGAHYVDAIASNNNIQIGNYMGNPATACVRASAASAGTTTQTLATQTIPANTLITGQTLRIKASGRVSGTAGTKLIRLQVNSTSVIVSNQAAGSQNPWVIEATIPIGANTSRTINVISPTPSQTAVSFSTTTAPVTILVNTTPAGGDVVTLDSFAITVE